MPNNISIELDEAEVRALRKTLGIAGENLASKRAKFGIFHAAGQAAADEAKTLLNIERKLLDALATQE